MLKTSGILAKFGPTKGDIKWTLTSNEKDLSEPEIGGVGFACQATLDGHVYSHGLRVDGGGGGPPAQGSVTTRKVEDLGDSFQILVSPAWFVHDSGGVGDPSYEFPRMDIDEFDNLYVPRGFSGPAVVSAYRASDGVEYSTIELSDGQRGRCVAVNPVVPDYGETLVDVPNGIDRPEFFYIGSRNGPTTDDGDLENLHIVTDVLVTANTGSARTVKNLAVSGGDIQTFDDTAFTTPTGGAGALDATSEFLSSTTLFGKVFFTDGVGAYKVYDARKDEVTDYASDSAGVIPPRAKLIAAWRGRIVLARANDEDGNWHMSKQSKPFNWDLFPAVVDGTEAINGSNSEGPGLVSDIINTIVPYTRDYLIFGCDHTIYMLRGDPAVGGQLELISDVTGMAFGRSWVKDRDGILYFFGSKGGVFRMAPGDGSRGGSLVQRVSVDWIERRLQDVDLSTHDLRLEIDIDHEELVIRRVPRGQTATSVTHWAWDWKAQSWWEDEYAITDIEPHSMLALDGDLPDDRVLILGCQDGRIRKVDASSADDDTETITSSVLMGPFQAGGDSDKQVRWHQLKPTFANDQNGVRYEMFTSESPDFFGDPAHVGEFLAGPNERSLARVKGVYFWLKLVNSKPGQRWAFEQMSIKHAPAGRRRVGVRFRG